MAAIQALGDLGGKLAKKCREQYVKNPNKVISESARQALSEMETRGNLISFQI